MMNSDSISKYEQEEDDGNEVVVEEVKLREEDGNGKCKHLTHLEML